MASYTDIIPQFNPYIQQLPVEAMVSVGMEKQRRYDEGIQKLQTQIDNIAGLDIIRDVDRAYLQSKINELGSNLRGVAAGDFSNFQLVNSVGGMINQVSKDPIVKNAVNSTALYRKEYDMMETARKEGKSSQQNQWDFKSKSANWLYSKDLGKSFNETYTPYIDVDKKFLEVMKTLHSDLTEQDIAQVTVKSADGTIDTTKTLAAMQRVSRESVSSEKIENALRASLTPDELNQLSINGRYQFRGYDTPEKLEVYSKAKYGSLLKQNDEAIKNLEGYANLKSSDPAEQKKAFATIEQLKLKNQQLKLEMDEEITEIYKDPEYAKFVIYKNGAISQFAAAHSWEHKKDNLLQNPVLEAEHWEKNYALDQSKFNLSVRAQNWNEYMDKEKLKIDKANLLIAQTKLQNEMFGGSSPFETYLGENPNVKSPLTAMNTDAINLNNDANTIVEDMARNLGASVAQVEESIRLYNSGNSEDVKKALQSIPVEWRDEVDRVIQNRNKASRLDGAVKQFTNEVENSAEFVNRRRQMDAEVNALPTLTLKDRNGRDVVFSGREVLEYYDAKSYTAVPYGKAILNYNRPLSTKEQLLASNDTDNALAEKYPVIRNQKLVTKRNEYYQDVNTNVNNLLMQRTGKYVPRLTTITFSSEGGDFARRTWEGIASSVFQRYKTDKGGSKELSTDDIDAALKSLTSEERQKITYKKLTQGDTTSLVLLLPGGKEIVAPLTSREAAQLPITDPNEPSSQYVDLTDALYLGNGNTNPTNDPGKSYFTKANMPYVKGVNVKADVTSSVNNTGKKFITLRMDLPGIGWAPLKLDDFPVSGDGAINFLGSMTTDDLKQLYLSDPRVPQEWKTAIQSIK